MSEERVVAHYGAGALAKTVRSVIEANGKDPDRLSLDDLTMLDEFHTLGRAATIALADAAGVGEGDRVLDVGAGIGGPARHLASTYGCVVSTIDLTPEFCDMARWLNRATGLGSIEVHCGSALDLPFADGAFDAAWTQHAQMNIADKARLYAEMSRVVKDGGTVAQWDVAAGPKGQPPHFPVPWSDGPETSHLATPDELLAFAATAGLTPTLWEDHTAAAIEFFATIAAGPPPVRKPDDPPPIALGVIVPGFPEKAANYVRSMEEDRLRVVRGVFSKG